MFSITVIIIYEIGVYPTNVFFSFIIDADLKSISYIYSQAHQWYYGLLQIYSVVAEANLDYKAYRCEGQYILQI